MSKNPGRRGRGLAALAAALTAASLTAMLGAQAAAAATLDAPAPAESASPTPTPSASPLITSHRNTDRAACRRYFPCLYPAPNTDCDEYPFATINDPFYVSVQP
jgi:hypothetical protein